MRQFDLAPLYRSTVGFDRLFSALDQFASAEAAPTYPPYNIERTGENAYRITVAVAGFTESDLSIEVRENALTLKGERKAEGKAEFLHQGIAARAFERRFQLADHVQVTGAALETLAVIAYKQPITAPEIMEIRGVQGAGVLKTLIERKLITTAGRKSVIGKPILYKTTKDFLVQFGLKSVNELPTLKEFEELRRLAFSEDEMPENAEGPASVAEAAAQPPEAAEPVAVVEPAPLAEAEPEAEYGPEFKRYRRSFCGAWRA